MIKSRAGLESLIGPCLLLQKQFSFIANYEKSFLHIRFNERFEVGLIFQSSIVIQKAEL